MAEFVAVARADDVKEGEMQAFDARNTKIAIAHVGGTFYAFGDTCTHMGCSLAEGDLEETTVTCPCHGFEFDVTSGEVLRGPARELVGAYEVRAEGQNVEIEDWWPKRSRSSASA
jgi:3-phenylpropionate/trans-cinnamate dioxygenase ferredoxin component